MNASKIRAAVADIAADTDPTRKAARMNSNLKAPSIPIDRPISWEDWQRGRRARRETSKQAAPGIVRRNTSSSDRRLRKLFNGQRGLPFARTDRL